MFSEVGRPMPSSPAAAKESPASTNARLSTGAARLDDTDHANTDPKNAGATLRKAAVVDMASPFIAPLRGRVSLQ